MIRVPCRYLLIVIVILSLMNLATIRKKEDPIAKTQTDPIAYNDKIQEMKEGPKGAPTPSFQLYNKSQFFTEPPVDQEAAEEKKGPEEKVTELGRLGEEEGFEEDWWLEEEEEKEETTFPADSDKRQPRGPY